ncbi:MAG TPA: GNAT family N-acetyltransferase [Acidimicrobiales bacterium]|nr:GNAT family N-acetyltransferase [Acidimicrobiales bacterium]
MPTSWRVVTIDHHDPIAPFEDVVRLIDVVGTATGAAYGRSDVVEALHEHQPAAVAVSSGKLVGAVVARVCGSDAHLLVLALHPEWRNRGIGSALLKALDQEIIHRGARRLLALMHTGHVGELAFANQGFSCVEGLHLYERAASMVPEELAVVERYGGHFPPAGLWGAMKGFSATKDLLERTVVAPSSRRELADQIGLVPPSAVLLFGPPGTGKTSFARAIASRLSWAFVELHPSLLGQGVEGATALRQALDDLNGVDRLVCFIDEADEIVPDRAGRPHNQALVNELLKSIPAFKSRPGRLMVMATNSVAAIDPAMLRPGRFDLIIPVGAPDEAGRAELAAELVPSGEAEVVAARTAGFTPADFALVAQRSAQRAFDRAVVGGDSRVTSADVLEAVVATRPSVSSDAIQRFELESRTYARL